MKIFEGKAYGRSMWKKSLAQRDQIMWKKSLAQRDQISLMCHPQQLHYSMGRVERLSPHQPPNQNRSTHDQDKLTGTSGGMGVWGYGV